MCKYLLHGLSDDIMNFLLFNVLTSQYFGLDEQTIKSFCVLYSAMILIWLWRDNRFGD